MLCHDLFQFLLKCLTESERLNLKSLNQSKINQNNDGMEPDKTGFGCLGGNTVKNYFRNLALF